MCFEVIFNGEGRGEELFGAALGLWIIDEGIKVGCRSCS
jgi:hypothetical protein